MKRQKGFSLIELLLVVAIISIIAIIAIPAFLGMRARARDRVAVNNLVGRLGDLQGQYDKYVESGEYSLTSIQNLLGTYLRNTAHNDRNPWYPTDSTPIEPFSSTVGTLTGSTKSVFETALETAGAGQGLGQVKFYIKFATANGPGFLGGAVKLQDKKKSGNTNKVQIKALVLE